MVRFLQENPPDPYRYAVDINQFPELEKIGDYLMENDANQMYKIFYYKQLISRLREYPILEIQTLILLILCNVKFKRKLDEPSILHSVPYDVVKIIMIKLWATRYDQVWDITFGQKYTNYSDSFTPQQLYNYLTTEHTFF